jgi:hypothetical protein
MQTVSEWIRGTLNSAIGEYKLQTRTLPKYHTGRERVLVHATWFTKVVQRVAAVEICSTPQRGSTSRRALAGVVMDVFSLSCAG